MADDKHFSENEIARVIGYARVTGSRPPRRGRKVSSRRFSPQRAPRLRAGAPSAAFA